ncbi:ATP-dependent DNA helicase RecG [Sanguibacter massiliensis]|uniref:ATP-dependent DNA helicase RecG n=1 Tax=Sanguibacter massiliensis TaxID=1973217 RepID=UPI000C83FDD0|nr:ATP-dependent DNA helicase RecG [Sanguibacter massiliensis]
MSELAVPADASGLDAPLERVLGKPTAKGLATLGLTTVGDLLRHYPRRYVEPGERTSIADLEVGAHVTVVAQVERATVRTMRARSGAILSVVVTDGSRSLDLSFFARHAGALRPHESRLVPGRLAQFSGTVSEYRGALQLTHPDYEVIEDAEGLGEMPPTPIYPATAQMPSWKTARAVRAVLPALVDGLPEPVPLEVRARRGLMSLPDAIRTVHAPAKVADAYRARRTLRFEEALVLQTELARRRHAALVLSAVPRPRVEGPSLLADLDARLPFDLTAGQGAGGEGIAADPGRAHPMQRLLQGDVGSGKTLVALRAMLQVVDAGGQAVLLAPTEVLAQQHHRTLTALLGPLAEGGLLGGDERATRVALLTGSLGAAATREALLDAASGRAGIVVGTHALLSERVQFAALGLVVVDEQHRFGVEQRDTLRTRGDDVPHMLVMTATPIPRTVAMTVFGDLEVSTLTEVPQGRAGITSHVVWADRPAWMQRVWQVVREHVDRGERVFVVCPRITGDDATSDGADLLDDLAAQLGGGTSSGASSSDGRAAGGAGAGTPPARRAVEDVVRELEGMPVLGGAAIGTLHGRMSSDERDRAMAAFLEGRTQVLVATTVIEVGVDVPLATVMVILDADVFGISQLHQLRGRVGRGTLPGTCFFVTRAEEGSDAAQRLTHLAGTTDGFELALLDLSVRREGDVLGASQSGGASSLRLLRVVKDADLIAEAREEATDLVAADPTLAAFPALAAAVEARLRGVETAFLDRG